MLAHKICLEHEPHNEAYRISSHTRWHTCSRHTAEHKIRSDQSLASWLAVRSSRHHLYANTVAPSTPAYPFVHIYTTWKNLARVVVDKARKLRLGDKCLSFRRTADAKRKQGENKCRGLLDHTGGVPCIQIHTRSRTLPCFRTRFLLSSSCSPPPGCSHRRHKTRKNHWRDVEALVFKLTVIFFTRRFSRGRKSWTNMKYSRASAQATLD